jgi:hypothetical protein
MTAPDIKRKLKGIAGVFPIVFLWRYDLFLDSKEQTDEQVSTVFLSHLFGGSYAREKMDYTVSVLSLIAIIYLTLLFSRHFVKDMEENCEYLFTRYKSRRNWYIRRLVSLFGWGSIGVGIVLAMYAGNAVVESSAPITWEDGKMFFCVYGMLVFFFYVSVLAINYISIYKGSIVGIVSCYSVIFFSSALTLLAQKRGMNQAWFHLLNPMSNIYISWNFTDIHVLWGILYFVLLSAVLIGSMWIKIRRMDLGIQKGRVG